MTAAMILCAGFGTRLRPLTNFIPKPLLPVGDRPAFRHTLDQLQAAGFGPIALNTHHRAESFAGLVPDSAVVLHEPAILGTAGGVANARVALGPGTVLVWNGDIQVRPDLAALMAEHEQSTAAPGVVATLVVSPRQDGKGTVGLDDRNRVVRLRGERFGREVAAADYLGIMVLSERARDSLPPEGCLVGDVLLPMLRAGHSIAAFRHAEAWVDIGTPALFLQANLAWLQHANRIAWREPGASVAPDVRLIDSVIAGGTVEGAGELRQCVVLPGGRLSAPSERCIAMPDGSVLSVPAH